MQFKFECQYAAVRNTALPSGIGTLYRGSRPCIYNLHLESKCQYAAVRDTALPSGIGKLHCGQEGLSWTATLHLQLTFRFEIFFCVIMTKTNDVSLPNIAGTTSLLFTFLYVAINIYQVLSPFVKLF